MYEGFFGMERTPFTKDMPAEELYDCRTYREVLDSLIYTAQKKGFAVITGDPGCGKSTLIRKFAAELPKEQYLLLYLSDSKLTPRWFYDGLLSQLGLRGKINRGESKKMLQEKLAAIHEIQGLTTVIVLDEAHLLDREMLEEFRFMLNSQFDSRSPMALVLAGQTELLTAKLNRDPYTAICQRVDVFKSLPHLDRADTERYVRRHLEYSGCQGEIFTQAALDEIYRTSSGIPRMINRVCEKNLMYACQQKCRLIDDHMIRFVVENEFPGGVV